MLPAGALFFALSLPLTPALARARTIDVPAGTVSQVAFAIGKQAGVNIAVRDASALSKKVAPIGGVANARQALQALAKSADLVVRQVGPRSFILEADRPVVKVAQYKPAAYRSVAQDVTPVPPAPQQDIIVTASKRETSSRRFAGQWTRLDGSEFRHLGVSGTEAIEDRTVGFSSTHLGAGRNKLFIRGIADSSFSGPTQSPVGQYFGDLRTGYSGPDPDLKLVDIEAIEVLEGPQGTLYGSGSLGGIVLFKPNSAQLGRYEGSLTAGVSATWHGDASYDLSGVLNIPVGQDVALRGVAYRANEGGYVDNRATGEKDINSVGVTGGRATLSAEASPGWFVDLVGVRQQIEGDDSQYADREGNRLSRSSLVDQPFSSDFSLASFVVRHNEGDVRFQSTTGATWQDVAENFDASLPGRIRQLRQDSRARAISHETRIWRPMSGGYSWLVGFSMIDNRYTVRRNVEEDGDVTDLAGVENRVREYTLYGEAGVSVLDNLEASIGTRYTWSSLRGSGEHLSALAAAALAEQPSSRSEHRLLPSASLLYRPAKGAVFYLRYQQGFRPGGLSISDDTVRLYRNDRLGTAEAGFRLGAPARGPFDLQGSITHSRWRDIQADFLDANGLPVTENIGDGRVWTATLNGGVALAPGLRADAGVAWNDGKITQPTPQFLSFAAATGSIRIPNISRVVFRGAIDWRHDLGNGRELQINGYARYVGSSRLGVGPHLGERQGDYWDSGLATRLAMGRNALSLTITNLTDSVGNRFAFGAPIVSDVQQITPLRPRTVRLGFETAF